MSEDAAEDSARRVVEQMVAALNGGDRDLLRDCLSSRAEAVHIGTDPTEWWTSRAVVESLGGSSELGVSVVVDDLSVHAVNDGVVWAVGRGHFEVASAPTAQPVRLSVVLAREGDRWTVVHSHASFGVPNADVFS